MTYKDLKIHMDRGDGVSICNQVTSVVPSILVKNLKNVTCRTCVAKHDNDNGKTLDYTLNRKVKK